MTTATTTMTAISRHTPSLLDCRRRRRRLVWHRCQDLRVHDNLLYSAISGQDGEDNTQVASVFIFDLEDFRPSRPSTSRPTVWDAVTMGPHSARILIESVQDLRQSLQKLKSDLIVRQTDPIGRNTVIDHLLQLVDALQISEVWWSEVPGVYEQALSQRVQTSIRTRFPQVQIHTVTHYTLYHPDDLPRGKNEWDKLSRPNEKKSKKKQTRRNHAQISSSSVDTTMTMLEKDETSKEMHVHLEIPSPRPHHSMVDISVKRWVGMPKIMGDFRRAASAAATASTLPSCNANHTETQSPFRPCLPTPDRLQPIVLQANAMDGYSPPTFFGDVPSLESLLKPLLTLKDKAMDSRKSILGLPHEMIYEACCHSLRIHEENKKGQPSSSPCSVYRMGGETSALKHLEDFIHNYAASAQRHCADVTEHQSAHFSHHLAFGCLSPRRIVQEVNRYQRRQAAQGPTKHGTDNDNCPCEWIISHLTMRDFFLYTCLASGARFFHRDGIPVNRKGAEAITWKDFEQENGNGRDTQSSQLHEQWERWCTGKTGLPLVDAGIRELLQTGYMSNRVRQNVASVLTKDLRIDWRAGAEFFQFLLLDHCVGANWGNWLYFSGVGPDPKHRHFRTISQAAKYDRYGTYVKRWLPELMIVRLSNEKSVPEELHLRPWDFAGIIQWRKPMVRPETQYTRLDHQRLEETGRLFPDEHSTP